MIRVVYVGLVDYEVSLENWFLLISCGQRFNIGILIH